MKKFIVGTLCIYCCLSTLSLALTNYYSDGSITDDDNFDNVFVWNDASVVMDGGQIQYLDLFNTSRFEMNSGIAFENMYAWNASELTMTNGAIYGSLESSDNAIVNLYGGSITDWLYAEELSVIHIYGYNFEYDPGAGSQNGGQLTGNWAYGGTFTFDFLDNVQQDSTYYDHVVLHEFIPEPGTLSLLTLGGLFMRKRK